MSNDPTDADWLAYFCVKYLHRLPSEVPADEVRFCMEAWAKVEGKLLADIKWSSTVRRAGLDRLPEGSE